ncbi:TPA: hypothetical protein CPT88_00580 [Candidatus Gastranaerophilales bacterium HUM_8]|nr:MAG TPA: hypothetical protein CPT88_00580 [Candidatus Gastranaerophilales bacterium HUM_8]DAA99337.1 MAG TPA: hypothetical protein CPT89_10265 [Candidatus Gastranaerophilales bacterium HUM_11]
MAKTKKDPIDEIIKVRRKLQSKFANDKTTINSSIIYHYTSPEGILGILTNHTLWLSEITYMNDESEITYTFDLLTDILAQNNDEICQTFKDSLEAKIKTRTQLPSNLFDYVHRDSIFVACFSTEQDELSLWNYYTKTGSMAGYNIGFKVDELVAKVKSKLKVMHHFIYGKTICEKCKQEGYLKEAIKEYNLLYQKMRTKNDKKNVIKSFWGLIHIFSLFFKKEAFKNENEYRFVITEYTDILQKHNRAFQIKNRIQNGLIIPYIELDFDKDSVSVITTSPTIKQDYYKAGVESLLHQNEYHQTKVEISDIPLRY